MSQKESVFIHPKALVETEDIGSGTRIWAFVHISTDTHVGKDCNVCDHVVVQSRVHIGNRVTLKEQVVIGTGSHIEDEAFLAPSVIMPNDRVPRSPRMAGVPEIAERYSTPENWLAPGRICRGASIGTGALIMPGVVVGAYAMVAAGTIVTKNVAPHQLLVGNPGQPRGWVCLCGVRLAESKTGMWKCAECGRNFQHTERQGLVFEG
ncbi:N-acetyltransferase [candidate division KSB1 bacterium]|nr:N-acetyltransferase [candidate division KSB1 bacterium]